MMNSREGRSMGVIPNIDNKGFPTGERCETGSLVIVTTQKSKKFPHVVVIGKSASDIPPCGESL